MAITLPPRKSPLKYQINTHFPTKKSTYNMTKTSTLSTNYFPSNARIQIQQPLHKPQYKSYQSIKKPNKDTIIKKTTCSDILYLMDTLNLPISLELYISLIKECTKNQDPFQAIKLSNHIMESGLKPTLYFLNKMLLMHICCGCYDRAKILFDRMPHKTLNTWAMFIAGCVENYEYNDAINMFIRLLRESKFRDRCDGSLVVSGVVICVLKACLAVGDLELGKQIHGWIFKMGYWRNMSLTSFLISFYRKFGWLEGRENVFDHIPSRNTSIWNARMVTCGSEEWSEGVRLYKQMGREGVKRSKYTFSSVLKACGKVSDGGSSGRQVHGNALKVGLDEDNYVRCGLISMYGKSGLLNEARMVHQTSREKRNDACWNALLTGYVQNGCCVEAIKLLYDMKAAGMQPPESLLKQSTACVQA
ncbi:hypothetical protein Leryth_010876 [Lithospermum erythrorhizon]|nr:hypothetical protein Leryth_010876 [Lithospermum erythrorhizon]